VAHENVDIFNLCMRVVLRCGHNQQRIVGSGDGLHRFGATGEERIRDAGNNKSDRSCAIAFEDARRLVWHITERLDDTSHAGERFWTDAVAAIDDTRDRGGADARSSGNFSESCMRTLLLHSSKISRTEIGLGSVDGVLLFQNGIVSSYIVTERRKPAASSCSALMTVFVVTDMAFENREVFAIGVDLGGTNLRIAAYAPGAGILKSVTLPTRVAAGPSAVVDDICRAIRELREEYREKREMVGIGVGSPGPLELPTGRLHNPPNLPGWDGFNLRVEMEERLRVPVTYESDGNVAALAEYVFGQGQLLGSDSLCMLTLGTGVGSGIVLNGKIWHGATGMAGEAGHMTIYPDGLACRCGSNGCLEMYASATALVNAAERLDEIRQASGRTFRKNGAVSPTARDLADIARQGDPDAQRIYAEAGRALGIGLANLVNILNLPLYVVGGGLANSWDLLAPTLFEELRYRSYVYRLTMRGAPASGGIHGGGTQVVPARLGSEAGLLGACILPLQETSKISTTSLTSPK
jgi:glucokinase